MAHHARPLLALWFVLAVGCANGVGLTVDVRTDYVARAEFGAVRTELSTVEYTNDLIVGAPSEIAVAPAANFLRGARVAEFHDLTPGTYWVRVSLLSDAGTPIAQRITSVQFTGSVSVTSVISRSCGTTHCPPAGSPTLTVCNGGVCVDPHCTPESPEFCGAGTCTRDADCTGGPTGECARTVCEGGACLFGGDDSLCGAGRHCTSVYACEPDVAPICGAVGEPCCAGGACDAGALCTGNGSARTCTACGAREQPCCSGDTCSAGAFCVDGPGGARVCQCGGRSQLCCGSTTCDTGLFCQSTGFGPLCLCGTRDRPCCPGRLCDDGSTCLDTGFGPLCLCGRRDTPCCTGRLCDDGSTCLDTGFGPLCLCGRRDTPCCAGRACDDGSTCLDTGFGPLCLCGRRDTPCCAGGVCDDGSTCNATGFGPICQ